MENTKKIATATQIFFTDMLYFMHYLRANGFANTSGETIAAFQALERLHLSDETEVFLGLRAVLCSTRAERVRFEQLFKAFFSGTENTGGQVETTSSTQTNQEKIAGQEKTETTETFLKTDTDREDATEQTGLMSGSEGGTENKETSFLQAVRQSQMASKQFTTVSIPSDHYAEMSKAARSFIRRVQLKPGRR